MLDVIKENKEKTQKSLVKEIKIFLKKKKNRKQEYGCERHKNFSENKK